MRHSGGHVTKFIVFAMLSSNKAMVSASGCAWDSSRDAYPRG
jgi:hypothetical protein